MKPNFALNLTHEAIGLLHRTARGWLTIGEAALDSADLTEALGYLRASALGLSPQGMTTKLVIPNSQILYTEVDAPATDPDRRLAQVRAALDGLTPYAVDELVFDVCGTGPRVQVAVVARETLAEAESFAVQHRMNPLSCVAIPPAGAFGQEPFFGATEHAAKVLAPGDTVERDAEPVSIISREESTGRTGEGQPRAARRQRAAATAAAAAAAAEAAAAARTPVTAPPEPVAPAAVPLVLHEPPQVGPTPDHHADAPGTRSDVTEPEAGATPTAVAVDEGPVAPVAEPAAHASPSTHASPPAPEEPDPWPEVAAEALVAGAPGPEPVAPAKVAPPGPAEAAITVPAPSEAVAAELVAARPDDTLAEVDTVGDDVPVAPAFSSRRRDAKAAPFAATRAHPAIEADDLAPPPLTRSPPPLPPAATAASAISEAKPVTRREAPPLTVVASVPGIAGIKAAAGSTGTIRGLPPAIEGAAPLRSVPRPSLAPTGPTGGAPAGASATVPPTAKPPTRGRTAGTSSPARGGALTAQTPRGKPRFLGLILTGLLLLFLVMVAAWSSIYLSRTDDETPPRTQVATVPDALPEAPAPVTLTTDALPTEGDPAAAEADPEYLADLAAMGGAVEEMPADPVDLVPDAADTGTAADLPPVAEGTADAVAPAEPAAPPPPAEEVAEPAPAPEVPVPAPQSATAGLASAAPLAAATLQQDEIFLAGTDAPPPAFDPAALPPPGSAAEDPPVAALPPPPAGTLYQFDEQGRILASETGVLMPGGFWMIEARPPILPPPRPAEVAAVTPAPDATATEAAAPAAVEGAVATPTEAPSEEAAPTVPTDPVIASLRPRSRPASLVSPAGPVVEQPAAPDAQAPEAQADDGAALALPADPDVAALRPRARPGTIATLAAAARQDSGGASLVQTASAAQADEPAPTDAVMALSPRPAPRPAALSRAVEAAVAEASLLPAPTVEAPEQQPTPEAEQAIAEPEADAEPEVATAAPRIPTRANVAKQATFANAMNLSKVNLIGIFGTPSDRYAMVRTSTGRMTRVKVGDRVDGGTVAAITASELRYQKGGKLLTLSMPRG